MTDVMSLREKCFAQTKAALQNSLPEDRLIIHTKEMIDDLTKANNQLAKRMREWAGGWIPELEQLDDHEAYLTKLTLSKEDILKELHEKDSIGSEIPQAHEEQLRETAASIAHLYERRRRLMEFLEDELEKLMPNTLAICGTSIAADLLAHAGSLKKLSRYPSGTIQLLGAESALFRHLRNKKHKVPKHGTIINHQLIQRAKRQDRGRVARALADKISIAAKVDFFKGEPCGQRLLQELEAKF